jgi:hypothetical protein
MNFLSGLALVLLTLVGYSIGSVLFGSGRKVMPGRADVIITLILWIGAFITLSFLEKLWAILLWLAIGFIAGTIVFANKRNHLPIEKTEENSAAKVTGLRSLWERWKAFGHKMGDFQGRLLLFWFYFIIVTPFGLIMRLFSDPLDLHLGKEISHWRPRPSADAKLEDVKRQF